LQFLENIMGYALRDQSHYTYADYRTWSEDVRYELVEGAAYMMAPAPSVDHQTLAFEVGRKLGNALEGHPCRVLMAPVDVLLSQELHQVDDAVDTVLQPDVLVVCDPQKVTPRGIRGAPDWILEVISPASASHDQIVKLAAYERAGVREYWLAHPVDRVLTIYRLDGTAYGRPQIVELTGETPVAVLAGVTIRWAPVVARLLAP
jgi:Uma2 family endonuclease